MRYRGSYRHRERVDCSRTKYPLFSRRSESPRTETMKRPGFFENIDAVNPFVFFVRIDRVEIISPR